MLKNYQEKLEQIRNEVSIIVSDLVLANEQTLDGFRDADLQKLDDVKEILKNIDRKSNEIDNNIITIIALFGPEANDLRELIAFLKVTNELVKISDNTKSYAKNIKNHYQSTDELLHVREYALPLHKTALAALKEAGRSLAITDAEELRECYTKVGIEESKTDDLYCILEKNVLSHLCTAEEFSASYINMLSTMRKLEKIADRALNITKLMLYANAGGKLQFY